MTWDEKYASPTQISQKSSWKKTKALINLIVNWCVTSSSFLNQEVGLEKASTEKRTLLASLFRTYQIKPNPRLNATSARSALAPQHSSSLLSRQFLSSMFLKHTFVLNPLSRSGLASWAKWSADLHRFDPVRIISLSLSPSTTARFSLE